MGNAHTRNPNVGKVNDNQIMCIETNAFVSDSQPQSPQIESNLPSSNWLICIEPITATAVIATVVKILNNISRLSEIQLILGAHFGRSGNRETPDRQKETPRVPDAYRKSEIARRNNGDRLPTPSD